MLFKRLAILMVFCSACTRASGQAIPVPTGGFSTPGAVYRGTEVAVTQTAVAILSTQAAVDMQMVQAENAEATQHVAETADALAVAQTQQAIEQVQLALDAQKMAATQAAIDVGRARVAAEATATVVMHEAIIENRTAELNAQRTAEIWDVVKMGIGAIMFLLLVLMLAVFIVMFFEFMDWHITRVEARKAQAIYDTVRDITGRGRPFVIVDGRLWDLQEYMARQRALLEPPVADEVVEGDFKPVDTGSNKERVIRLLKAAIKLNGSDSMGIPTYTKLNGWGGQQWCTAVALLKPEYVRTMQGNGGGTQLVGAYKTLDGLLTAVTRGDVPIPEHMLELK